MNVSPRRRLFLSILGAALSMLGFVLSVREILAEGSSTARVIGICATVVAMILTVVSIVRTVRKMR